MNESVFPATCYLCGTLLVDGAASDEHIIPNALGGVLHTADLLCGDCNSLLGRQVDAPLCKHLAPLASLLGVERDRGASPAVPLWRADGTRVLLDPEHGLRLQRPEWSEEPTEGGVKITVTAGSSREAKRTLHGRARRWKRQFGNVSVGPVQHTMVEVDERMHFRLEGGGAEAFRAVAKIALGYYLSCGGDRAAVGDVIDYIRTGTGSPVTDVGWYDGPQVVAANGDAVLRHVVAVRGGDVDGPLLGYVELFGVMHFTVVLSRSYTGPPVDRAHVLSLRERQSADTSASNLEGYPWLVSDTPSVSAMRNGLREVMIRGNEVLAIRRLQRRWGKQLDGAVRAAFAAAARGRAEFPTEDLMPHLMRELDPILVGFSSELVDRRRRREQREQESVRRRRETDSG